MKKIITLLSALAMIFTLSLFFSANAAKEMTEDQYNVVIDNIEYELLREYDKVPTKNSWDYAETNRGYAYRVINFFYDEEIAKNTTELNILSEVNGLPVTAISTYYDNRSFKKNITKVTIPETVEVLGTSAFGGFSALEEIVLPQGLRKIYMEAFENCTSLKAVTTGNKIDLIDEYAFAGCKNLTSISIPDTVETIYEYAFHGSGIEEIEIPEGCIIRHRAFKNCKNLKKVTINFTGKDKEYYTIPKAVFYNCESLEAIYFTGMQTQLKTGKHAFTGCDKLKDIYFFGSEKLWNETCMSGKRNEFYKEFDIHFYHNHKHEFEKAKSAKNTLKFACDCGDEYIFTAKNTSKHNYTKWNTVEKANCVVGTKHTFTCKDCGKKATFKLKESNKHNLGQWKTVKKATVEAEGRMEKACKDCDYKETKTLEKLTAVSSLKIKLYMGGIVTYNKGNPVKVRVFVYDGKTELTENLHYKLSFKNNKNVTNKAVVIVEGIEKNGYSGKVKLNYTIKPTAVKSKTAKATTTETTIKLTWKAVEEADGYVIYVNNYNEDTEYHKEFYATKNSYTIKNLKPDTGYGIEIRSCVIEDGERILGNSVFEMISKTK